MIHPAHVAAPHVVHYKTYAVCSLFIVVQAYEKDAEDYRHEFQVSPQNGINGHLPAESSQSSLVSQLDEMHSRYQMLVAESSDLLSKLDSAVICCSQYDELADEVGRALPNVESLADQCAAGGIADTESSLQHQLDLVTTAANRVAGLGKVMSEFERAGAMAVEALADLDLTDSDRVHTIQQDVETTKSRFSAVQQSTSEQQRLVNAAFAQLQDPSHNLAVLLNWVGRSLLVLFCVDILALLGPVNALMPNG